MLILSTDIPKFGKDELRRALAHCLEAVLRRERKLPNYFNFANFSDPEKPPGTEFEHGITILEGFL